jgi:hypothetical protein
MSERLFQPSGADWGKGEAHKTSYAGGGLWDRSHVAWATDIVMTANVPGQAQHVRYFVNFCSTTRKLRIFSGWVE